jgi:proteasome lid subunit RPN8/RPN11
MAKALEKAGDEYDIMGIIHSHPAPPYPSSIDRENMKLWPVVWLIVDSRVGNYKAWIGDREIEIIEI